MLRELLYTGLGTAVIMKTKIEDEIQKLQDDGKIQSGDAKNLLETLEQKGKDEEDKIKQTIKDSLKEIIVELNIATKDDISKLQKELQEIKS